MSLNIKNKHSLKKKEIKLLFKEVENLYSIDFNFNKLRVETGFFDERKIIFIDDTPCFILINDKICLTLQGVIKLKPKDKFIIVDMGSISFITKGADLMAPGIVDADNNIQKDDCVWICDETHKKPLATGIAIMNGEEMIEKDKGKSVEIIHYVGDKYWNINK